MVSLTNTLFRITALQGVEMQYKEDIINVCKFHSKLDIFDCPEFSETSQIRCRFIAALLRLGDELDIDQYRVNVQTVKTFGYTLDNSIFWYIHDHTRIQIKGHGIFVKVYLTKNDYQVCGSILQDIVINTFDNKNRKLTEILASNNINIFLSINSKVEMSEYADPLPKEIQNQIVAMGKMTPDKVIGNNFDDHEKTFMKRLNDIRSTINNLFTRYAVEKNELCQTYKLIYSIRKQREKIDKLAKDAISIVKKALYFIQGLSMEDLLFLDEIGVWIHFQVIEGVSQSEASILLKQLSKGRISNDHFDHNLWDYALEQAERILCDYECITSFNLDSVVLFEGYVYKKTSGKLLAVSVSGEAYKVFVWNLSNGTREPVAVLGGLYEKVYDLKILQEADRSLVIGKGTRRIYVWNLSIKNLPICIFEDKMGVSKYVVLKSLNGGLYALGVTTNDICLWEFFKSGEPIKRIKIRHNSENIFIVNTRLGASGVSYDLMGNEAMSSNVNGKIWEVEEVSELNFVFTPILDEKVLNISLHNTNLNEYIVDSYRILPHKKILGVLTRKVLLLYDIDHKKQLSLIRQEGSQAMNFDMLEKDDIIYLLVHFLWMSSRDDGNGLVRCFPIENGTIIESQQWFRNENDILKGVITCYEDEIRIFFSEHLRGTIYTTAYNRKDFSEFYKLPETMYIIDVTCG